MPKKFISNNELRILLSKATDDEKYSLTKLLDNTATKAFSSIKLQKEICSEGGQGVVNLFRGQGTGYLDIVDDVADELNIRGLPSYSSKVSLFDEKESLKYEIDKACILSNEYAELAEEKIIISLLEMAYSKMSSEDKASFDKQINKVAQEFDSNSGKGLVGATGLLVLGNLGGFATYTFLTTAMSAISMGTLGFGAYTAATSLLSIALGPVGWAGLGITAVWALGKPEYQKLIPVVATIGAIRQRVKYEAEVRPHRM